VQNTLGCLLARAAGRSPLEYLDQSERDRQIRIVLKLIANQPNTIPALIETFASELSEETR
jgi:hypothetical protein